MKPFEELTRLGRIRRMRILATSALQAFGCKDANIQFIRQAGNTLFRVQTSSLPITKEGSDFFENNQYLLRIHQPGYQEVEAIQLELQWLLSMRRDANLPVPEPIPTLDGSLLHLQEISCIPFARHCSLLKWIKGRSVKNTFRSHHFRAHGRLMAQLHNFASEWQIPTDSNKRKFDWEGLFQNDVGSGMPNGDAWSLLSPFQREAFSIVAERVKELMDDWGENPDIFGLIHGDLGVDANLLFWHGEPRAIDFDDSGFGYYVFDLAVALDAVRDRPDYTDYKEALLKGYR
jgi:Ser/Thr protein kinase RdoA (MazF antagonist)